MPQDITDASSTLVQEMAWCSQATISVFLDVCRYHKTVGMPGQEYNAL